MVAAPRLAGNATLRRLELASLLWNGGEQVYVVGLLVLAHRAAGSLGVAAVGILQAVPAVVLLPIVLHLTARQRADRMLRLLIAIRALSISAAVILAASGVDFAWVLAGVAIDGVAGALARPARSVLIPSIARTAQELVSSNVAISSGRSLAGLLGPAAATALIAGPGSTAALALGAVLLAASAAVTLGLHGATPLLHADASGRAASPRARGLAALRRLNHPRLVAGLVVAEQFVRGMLPVLIVGLAIDQIAAGDSAVGILSSAIGLGGLIGGFLSIALVRRIRLATGFVVAVVAWGAGVAIPGLAPTILMAAVGLAIAGAGRSVIEVASVTLLQRTVPVAERPAVFGLLESFAAVALALGAVGGALLVVAVGAGSAMVIAGCLPIALAILSWNAIRSADESVTVPEADMQLLRQAPMLRPLALSTIEELASDLRHVTVEPGTEVVTQGDPGDAFYIVKSGALDVSVDGATTRRLGGGDSFGEIALLRDSPRTATVRAIERSSLVALDREPFLAAVLGRHDAAAAAQDVVRGHLGG